MTEPLQVGDLTLTPIDSDVETRGRPSSRDRWQAIAEALATRPGEWFAIGPYPTADQASGVVTRVRGFDLPLQLNRRTVDGEAFIHVSSSVEATE